ncbi:putative ubiquitin-conjugating enzyme E2 [Gregarina niphandrodes]|uniref:Ubiquitin-conjugating enzyme E2 n=1 Tax=Gregarina niphandrodes TaxID=110365 RepID=A0A023B9Q3_GRENI|nr:putative ubiquitin-conjugating enzyme E2 [Gregarina niphandrodes]EZG72995.1 putative ubiquitin-conjugating enzyme E2 [Gregarina niphandrodes]|eukprot:XP_011129690.1 putative ubiquitin-conjugating enzyme E2 [Gregarina niphandrodes]
MVSLLDWFALELQQSGDAEGCSVGLENDNWQTWRVALTGPPDSPYEGGLFSAILTFPDDFPNNPPKMKFETPIFHPNIFPDGLVCISILHAPGFDETNEQELPEERWRPIISVEAILMSVISMLGEPNLDSPANVDAAKLLRENPRDFKRKVRRMVEEM